MHMDLRKSVYKSKYFSFAEQLTEIRKTTLAGVICANEELLDQAQPRVMETVSATNPLVDCRELPQPRFAPWKTGLDKNT